MGDDALAAWAERVGSDFGERLEACHTPAERALVLADLRELLEAAGADPRSGLTDAERARWQAVGASGSRERLRPPAPRGGGSRTPHRRNVPAAIRLAAGHAEAEL